MAGAVVGFCNGPADPGVAHLYCVSPVTTYVDWTLAVPCTNLTSVPNPPGPPLGPTNGVGCTNPGLTDSHGNATFFAANGFYWALISGYQVVPQTFPVSLGGGGGGGGLTPCGVINDVQLYGTSSALGCDSGILIGNPTTHVLSDNILNANQQVDVSDATNSGLFCEGHSNGSSVDAAFCIQPNTTFSTTNLGYGLFPPDNAPSGVNQNLSILSLTPVNVSTAYGTIPFYKTQWIASGTGAEVSAEDRQYLFTNTACNDPATCADIPFTPIAWSPNVAFMGPPTNTDNLGYLSNTANYNASVAGLTHAVTLPNVITTGDPLVVEFASGTNVSTIADTCGNTFILTPLSGWKVWHVSHALPCLTKDTITITLTGSDGAMILAGEVINGGDLDTFSSGSTSCGGSPPNTIAFASVTTSTAGILIGLASAQDTGTGAYQTYYPSTDFTIENQLSALVGGLGTNRSFMIGWQPAAIVGSNHIAISGDLLSGGSPFVCPETVTLAFKPASGGNAGYPTPRDIRLKDLQASTDFGGLADGDFYWYNGLSQALVAGSFGSGLSLDETTGVLAATGSGGTVTSVSGTTNQIDVATGTTTPVISLDGQYTSVNYATCTNTADALTVTLSPAPTSLANGLTVQCRSSAANTTTTPTLKVGALTAHTIVKGGSTGQQPLVANDILTNMASRFTYNATATTWELQNPQQLAAGSGTVTSIATTSPITGGTITTTGTIACATCVVASSPGAGVAHFAGSTQTVTSSPVVGSDMTNNTVTATQLAAQYSKLRCEPGLGDGTNAMAAATYLQTNCYNDTSVTWTITGIKCFTDNSGTSTLAATNGAGTALLTGAVTCTSSFAAGTQSATVTIAAGDFIEFTFVADGTSKQTTWVVSFTQ